MLKGVLARVVSLTKTTRHGFSRKIANASSNTLGYSTSFSVENFQKALETPALTLTKIPEEHIVIYGIPKKITGSEALFDSDEDTGGLIMGDDSKLSMIQIDAGHYLDFKKKNKTTGTNSFCSEWKSLLLDSEAVDEFYNNKEKKYLNFLMKEESKLLKSSNEICEDIVKALNKIVFDKETDSRSEEMKGPLVLLYLKPTNILLADPPKLLEKLFWISALPKDQMLEIYGEVSKQMKSITNRMNIKTTGQMLFGSFFQTFKDLYMHFFLKQVQSERKNEKISLYLKQIQVETFKNFLKHVKTTTNPVKLVSEKLALFKSKNSVDEVLETVTTMEFLLEGENMYSQKDFSVVLDCIFDAQASKEEKELLYKKYCSKKTALIKANMQNM